MTTRDLYINAQAASPKAALVRSVENATPVRMTDLVAADTVLLNIYLTDGEGNLHADSGSAAIGVRVGVGTPGALPTSGTFTLTFAAATTSALAYNATAAQVQTALAALAGIGTGQVSVTGQPGGYIVEFIGTLAGTDVGAITITSTLFPDSWAVADVIQAGGSGDNEIVSIRFGQRPLVYLDGVTAATDHWEATLGLNTAWLCDALQGETSAELTFEVELEDAIDQKRTILQVPVTVLNDVLTEFSTVAPLNLSEVFTEAESRAAFVQNRSTVTGLTGGGATNLDGIPTVDVTAGWVVRVRVSNLEYTYRLVAGTTAESSPDVIRPDDYNASTNAKVWLLDTARVTSISAGSASIFTATVTSVLNLIGTTGFLNSSGVARLKHEPTDTTTTYAGYEAFITSTPGATRTGVTYGFYGFTQSTGAQNFSASVSLVGVGGVGRHSGLQNMTGGAVGVSGLAGISSDAAAVTLAAAYGLYADFRNSKSGATITNGYGVFCTTPTIIGTITNSFGVYIAAMAGTNKWGIYQAGGGDTNYFGGNVLVGTTARGIAGTVFEAHLTSPATSGASVLGYLQHTLTATADSTSFNTLLSCVLRVNTNVNYTSTASDFGQSGILGAVLTYGTGTVALANGVRCYLEQTNAGTLTNAHCVFAHTYQSNAGAVITNLAGFRFKPAAGSGSVTTCYGLRIDPLIGTTRWGIYQEGVNDANYFGGKCWLGTVTGSEFLSTGQDLGVYYSATFGTTTVRAATESIIENTHAAGASTTQCWAVIGRAVLSGSGGSNTSLAGVGCHGTVTVSSSGSTSQLVAGTAGIANKSGTGAVASAAGAFVQIQNSNATGAITNGYGLYVGSPVLTGTITNEWGVYVASTTARNYFAGPVQFASAAAFGTLLEGDVFNDATRKCLVARIAGATQYDSRVLFVATASKTIEGTTSETSMIGTGVGTLTLPAGFLTIGKSLRIRLGGVYSMSASPPTTTFRVKLGSTTLASAVVALKASASSERVALDFQLTCRTTGAAGTVVGQGELWSVEGVGDVDVRGLAMGAAATINTTGTLALDVTAQPDADDGSNSQIVIANVWVEVLA